MTVGKDLIAARGFAVIRNFVANKDLERVVAELEECLGSLDCRFSIYS